MASTEGIIFDIQRFSLHDGPGIRTTVFLKGCPLNCIWCHNPEAKSPKPQLSYREDLCALCLSCVEICPNKVHVLINGKHTVAFEKCDTCGSCVHSCSEGALSIIGSYQSVDNIIGIVLKDKNYYKNSGGGLTISGGEPMAQFEFTFSLLKSAKENGIHTVIETCGQSKTTNFLKIIPFVDLFLFDFKATDPLLHKEFTGVSNNLILANLKILLENNANIILRCPLIPGINDSHDHLAGICELQTSFPNLCGIEILAYHNLGRDKPERIGIQNKLSDLPSAEEIQKENWLKLLTECGCKNIKIS